MDNLCHTLTGAALGEAGLKRATRWGTPTLMIAANLPDVDAFVFFSDLPSVAFRRGWTHGVGAQVLLPAALSAILIALDRLFPPKGSGRRVQPGAVLALSYAGVLSHVYLDYLNTYGIRLLMPFSGRWFYGDAVFIIDPWLWLVLGAGVWWARRRRAPRPARLALGLAATYTALMLASALAARSLVLQRWGSVERRAPQALMVGPMPVDPFRRAVIADVGEYYRTGTFTWLGTRLRLDDRVVPKNDALPPVLKARGEPDVRRILVWARFPHYVVERDGQRTRVTLQDMRFGPRVGQTTAIVAD